MSLCGSGCVSVYLWPEFLCVSGVILRVSMCLIFFVYVTLCALSVYLSVAKCVFLCRDMCLRVSVVKRLHASKWELELFYQSR
jgi:hypothetical protein